MSFLFALAVIPGIVLMIYIYIKDSREKEPLGLLLSLFGLGAVSIIPVAILELLFGFIEEEGTYLSLIIMCVCVIGLFEELGKFIFLKLRTWKNKNFNCTFDGIVYSVFVSLGFATLENIMYVLGNGIATGILRAFTSVPGHASFAVIMGHYYSKMRQAKAQGKKGAYIANHIKAIVIPMLVHGFYDVLAMTGTLGAFLLFLVYVVVMFIFCFIIVKKDASTDISLLFYEPIRPEFLPYAWSCPKCGLQNVNNFCIRCGKAKPND